MLTNRILTHVRMGALWHCQIQDTKTGTIYNADMTDKEFKLRMLRQSVLEALEQGRPVPGRTEADIDELIYLARDVQRESDEESS